MSDDVFAVLTDEERAEFEGIVKAVYRAGIDKERLFRLLLLGHRVLAFTVVEGLVEELIDIAVRNWNVKAGAKQGA